MAIEIRVDPIDIELDVAVGIDLPMNNAKGSSFKLNYLTLDQAVANAKNLLLTDAGERVMLPTFGCDLKRSLFENITQQLTDSIENRIKTSFAYWLPYIFINELSVRANEDRNMIQISLLISLGKNQFDTRSIILTLTQSQNV